MTIIVEAREPDRILKLLKKKGVNVEREFLEVGDYLLDNGYAIERKDNDLISSVISHRIFEQLNAIYDYEHPIFAYNVENLWKMFYYSHSRYVHKQYLGVINTIITKYPKITLMPYHGEDQFIDFLVSLDKKINSDGKSSRPKPMMRKGKSLKIYKENVLCGIPGIGVSMAIKLLDKFGSVNNISRATVEELSEIDKLGKKKIEKILEVLN